MDSKMFWTTAQARQNGLSQQSQTDDLEGLRLPCETCGGQTYHRDYCPVAEEIGQQEDA